MTTDIERHVEPGKPNQKALIEIFSKTYKDEVLDFCLFESLEDVRSITERWIEEYNEKRPHDSLNGLPPTMYREMIIREVFSLRFLPDGEAYAIAPFSPVNLSGCNGR